VTKSSIEITVFVLDLFNYVIDMLPITSE